MEKKRGKDSWKIKRLKKVRKAGVFVFTDLHPNFFFLATGLFGRVFEMGRVNSHHSS